LKKVGKKYFKKHSTNQNNTHMEIGILLFGMIYTLVEEMEVEVVEEV